MSVAAAAPVAQPLAVDQPASRPFRGLLIALLLSIPFWVLAIWAISHVI